MLFAVRLQGEGRTRQISGNFSEAFDDAFPAEQRDALAALLQMFSFASGGTEKWAGLPLSRSRVAF